MRRATLPKLDIFSYTDPSKYLREALTLRKKQSKLRMGSLAKGAGIGSSSLLSMILTGKRKLNLWHAEKLADALSLKGKHKKYFLAMLRFQNGKTLSERTEAQQEMLKIKQGLPLSSLLLEQYRFLSQWYYPVLYILAGIPSTKWDLKILSKRLGGRVNPKQIQAALDDLVKLGILKLEGKSYIRLIEHPVTEEDLRHTAIQSYHQQMIESALVALEQPIDQREFNGVTIAIPKEQLPVVKDKIREFRKEINEYLAEYEPTSDEVYQINLHLFQLTKPVKNQEEV
jgi:uncharacterized protein (TIGR02147 family)